MMNVNIIILVTSVHYNCAFKNSTAESLASNYWVLISVKNVFLCVTQNLSAEEADLSSPVAVVSGV